MSKITRINTLRAAFDRNKPRPTPMDIHRWCDEILHIQEDQLDTLQLVGKYNLVYIKLTNRVVFEQLLHNHQGTHPFLTEAGTTTSVTISDASAEFTHVRVFNLPRELSNESIQHSLQTYGTIGKIEYEYWSQGYKFRARNGVRSVQIELKKPIPSNLLISGHEAYITYAGQPPTCNTCGETTHFRDRCPYQKFTARVPPTSRVPLLSDLFQTSAAVSVDAPSAPLESSLTLDQHAPFDSSAPCLTSAPETPQRNDQDSLPHDSDPMELSGVPDPVSQSSPDISAPSDSTAYPPEPMNTTLLLSQRHDQPLLSISPGSSSLLPAHAHELDSATEPDAKKLKVKRSTSNAVVPDSAGNLSQQTGHHCSSRDPRLRNPTACVAPEAPQQLSVSAEREPPDIHSTLTVPTGGAAVHNT